MAAPIEIDNPPENTDSVGCGHNKEGKSIEQRKRPEFTGTLHVNC